jgi:3-hydroxyacyl-[acyl-carrier-protein] dehydratase
MELDISQICKLLPHRFPFLLIDRVSDLDLNSKKITAVKNVTVNEPFFTGHFPENPVFPGVLLVEACAQASGILLNSYTLKSKQRENQLGLLVEYQIFILKKVIKPGDIFNLLRVS